MPNYELIKDIPVVKAGTALKWNETLNAFDTDPASGSSFYWTQAEIDANPSFFAETTLKNFTEANMLKFAVFFKTSTLPVKDALIAWKKAQVPPIV